MHNRYTRALAFLLLCGMAPSASAFSDLDILQAIEQKNVKYINDCLSIKGSVINLQFGDEKETPLMYAVRKLVMTTKATEKRFAPSMAKVGLGFFRMCAGIGTTFAGLALSATSAAAAHKYNEDLFQPITNDGATGAEKNSFSNFAKRAWSFFVGDDKVNSAPTPNKHASLLTDAALINPKNEKIHQFKEKLDAFRARRKVDRVKLDERRAQRNQNKEEEGPDEITKTTYPIRMGEGGGWLAKQIVGKGVEIPPELVDKVTDGLAEVGEKLDRFTDEAVAQVGDVVDVATDALDATNVQGLNTMLENGAKFTTTAEQKFRAYDTVFLLAGTMGGLIGAFYGLKWGAQGIYRMFSSTAGTYNHGKDIEAYREVVRTLLDNKGIDLSIKDKNGKTALDHVHQAMVECMADKDSYALLRDIESYIKIR